MLWLNIDMKQILGIVLNDGVMVLELTNRKSENLLVSSRWYYWLSFADLIMP